MAVPGPSRQEGRIVEAIAQKLRRAGAPVSAIKVDPVHRRAPTKGEVGNLVLRLPGNIRAPRRLLMAHVDTVPLCVGAKPVVNDGWVVSADSRTGVGADNRGGTSVILNAALTILSRDLPHPPLTFLWPVQEEIGLVGARHASLAHLGKPKLAFNWDGGPPEKVTIGATGAYRMTITVHGRASHAGGAPELGVSAIAIAALAIADLERDGWHGLIRKAHRHGTSNVGIIRGGESTNVVADLVQLRAEARSHDPRFRRRIVSAFERAFQTAAEKVRSAVGVRGRVEIERQLDYEAFQLDTHEPCVTAAENAMRTVGLEPYRAVSNGGLDANWLTARGIPTVTLGCGQLNPHTLSERLNVAAFQDACRIALCLATASEPPPR